MRGSDARNHTVPNNSASSLTVNQNTGMNHVLIGLSASRKPSNGPDGPPRNKVTAIADMVITFMNSARKKIAKRMPVYSVMNPPTSSCSASTRSNGGWLVSAAAAIRKMMNGTNAGSQNHSLTNECQFTHDCCAAMSRVDSVPARISTPRMPRPNAASYDSSCADERTEPSNGYFEPDDQPASITPYTPRPDIARIHNAPIGRSATCRYVSCPNIETRPPIGITQNNRNAGRIERYGARRNTVRSAVSGIDCSLKNSLMPSANVCSTPNGPALLGPMRFCMSAIHLRMPQM